MPTSRSTGSLINPAPGEPYVKNCILDESIDTDRNIDSYLAGRDLTQYFL
jgi:hypothetical protein